MDRVKDLVRTCRTCKQFLAVHLMAPICKMDAVFEVGLYLCSAWVEAAAAVITLFSTIPFARVYSVRPIAYLFCSV